MDITITNYFWNTCLLNKYIYIYINIYIYMHICIYVVNIHLLIC